MKTNIPKRALRYRLLSCLIGILPIVLPTASCGPTAPGPLQIESLSEFSTDALRQRGYGSVISVEKDVDIKPWKSYLASYISDGLRLYTRVDIPIGAEPEGGYPVVIFVHGWTGIERAPTYDFYYREHQDYAEMVDTYVEAGFAVLVPGWRGHGEVDGVPADGIEYMAAFDNGSYLSPVFYAIDVLNLVDGLQTFDAAELDLSNINLVAHSQGGDVALIALAVSGEGSMVTNPVRAGSIWSGTFPSRFTQVHTYHPMETSPEAFMSGDGTWTGTAVGENGKVNANFVFGYPSDWIGTVDRSQWTWQDDTWSKPSVHDAVRDKFTQMYGTVNAHVADIDGAQFEIAVGDDDSFHVEHDARIADAMANIGAFDLELYLSEPLVLQFSDRDFYSFPEWNVDLCSRVNAAGGKCYGFEYAGNTHALRISEREWFSSADSIAGFDRALARDIALFSGVKTAFTDSH